MKSKALIGIAVASTFGWAAAAQAGPFHGLHQSGWNESQQSSWVAAGEEHYPPMVMFDGVNANLASSSSFSGDEGIGSTSASAGGAVGGSIPSDDRLSSSASSLSFGDTGGEMSSLSMDESIDLASDGTYSDYYLVSWTPVDASDWDVYLIEPDTDYLVLSDDGDYLVSSYDVTLFPTDYFGSPELSSDSGTGGEDFSS